MNDKPITLTAYLRKGGVGKTTLVALLGQFLAALGFRVAIIDLDRQGSQAAVFDLVDETGRGGEILHLVLKRRVNILAALTPVAVPRLAGHEPGELYVVPGGPQTAEAIEDIAANPVRYKMPDTLDVVRGPIAQLAGHVDFVLIDMGPSDQVTALVGLAATDRLLIPTTMDYLSVTSIAPVMDEFEPTKEPEPEQGATPKPKPKRTAVPCQEPAVPIATAIPRDPACRETVIPDDAVHIELVEDTRLLWAPYTAAQTEYTVPAGTTAWQIALDESGEYAALAWTCSVVICVPVDHTEPARAD